MSSLRVTLRVSRDRAGGKTNLHVYVYIYKRKPDLPPAGIQAHRTLCSTDALCITHVSGSGNGKEVKCCNTCKQETLTSAYIFVGSICGYMYMRNKYMYLVREANCVHVHVDVLV